MAASRLVWMNGTFVPESEAKISIYDSALMFGDMVFEMTRSFNKKQFKLKEHLERLYASMEYLRIPVDIKIDDLEAVVYETIQANEPYFNDNDEHRIMIDVSRGLLGIYDSIDGLHKGCNIIVADFPLRWTVRNMGHLFDTGINAVIPSQRTIPASLLEPKVKNRSRVHYLMANIQVSNFEGNDNWALLLDPEGYIAEGTGDNFFIVKNKKIITPEPRNILRGISRQYVIDILCPQLGFDVIERNIEPYDVINADEAFMTGTPFCMLPVVTVDKVNIGDGVVGDIFNSLLQKWSENVDVDIKKQIQAWDNEVEINSNCNSAPTPYKFKK